jgi:hypothetical protein
VAAARSRGPEDGSPGRSLDGWWCCNGGEREPRFLRTVGLFADAQPDVVLFVVWIGYSFAVGRNVADLSSLR